MVFGLFSKERSLKRTIAKATNKLSQQADRWAAMESLSADGSEEALLTLYKRFSFASSKMIEDEQEKEWTVETLVSKGPAALAPLLTYVKSASSIAYPLRVLEGFADRDTAITTIDQILATEEPGYTRDTQKRIQLISWLSEYKIVTDTEAVERIARYIEDFDENVRFAVVEALSLRHSPGAAEPLVRALVRPEEESQRLKIRIAEVLAEGEMDLCGKKNDVSALLADVLTDFKLHRDKLVRKKK